MPRPPIEHVVVLMLENRSFDHLLGFIDGRVEPVDGLRGDETNPMDPHDPASARVCVSRGAPYVTKPDPGHDFTDVTVQLFGIEQPPHGAAPTMDGFVYRYRQRVKTPDEAAQVMACFDPDAVPALSTLAREFVVCDHWFSSVPGPTWPNRFFAHCATSGGELANPVSAVLMGRYTMHTVYEQLESVGRSWGIYYGDIPQSLVLERLQTPAARRRFRRFTRDRFARDVADGDLPSYAFIEPRYFGLGHGPANDEHASHNVRHGEDLLGDVYEALRAVPEVWERTLLVVVFDEHGGFYDHVAPPATVNPDPKQLNPKFDFTRLGARVPCLLVSPFVARGATIGATLDHTAIIATVQELYGIPRSLTARDAWALTFTSVLSLDEPRDTPETLPRPHVPLAAAAPEAPAAPETLSDLQHSLLALAERLDAEQLDTERPPPGAARSRRLAALGVRTAAELDREEAAADYVRRVMRDYLGE